MRRAVEAYLGSPVVEAASQPGGFSPGVAARLRLRDGRRAFLKAVRARWNPDTPTLHRTEATIAASLPGSVPAPRFLWSYDDGECVALLFEDVEGRTPTIPWREDELRRVLLMVTELAASMTPAPITAAPAGQTFERLFTGWRRFRENPAAAAAAAGVDAWARSHLDRLADLEARWPEGTGGETLLHMDLRADNILLTTTGVLVVDWPWVSIGAAWLDLLLMLPSISMQGGPPPWELFDAHPVARGADPDAVTAAVAGLAGFFLFAATLPPPPGLPTVRRFQRAQGRHALRWLAQRTGWPGA